MLLQRNMGSARTIRTHLGGPLNLRRPCDIYFLVMFSRSVALLSWLWFCADHAIEEWPQNQHALSSQDIYQNLEGPFWGTKLIRFTQPLLLQVHLEWWNLLRHLTACACLCCNNCECSIICACAWLILLCRLRQTLWTGHQELMLVLPSLLNHQLAFMKLIWSSSRTSLTRAPASSSSWWRTFTSRPGMCCYLS